MTDNEKMLQKIYRGQIANRILLIVVLLFTIGNLVLVGVAGVRIKQFTKMIEPAINVINQLNVEEFNKTITTLNNAIDVFKINDVLDTISKVDFSTFTQVMSNIDVAKLNSTLDKIDDATNFMKGVGNSLRSFLDQFGIGLNF